MLWLRSTLLFLPMPWIGVQLIGASHQLVRLRTVDTTTTLDPPGQRRAQVCIDGAPTWAPGSFVGWCAHDPSDAHGFLAVDAPEDLLASWGIEAHDIWQASALFDGSEPTPSLDRLFAVTVFDRPHAWGPFRQHRMRAFRIEDGRPVEVPGLSATLGIDHPCALAARVHAHLREDHAVTTTLAVHPQTWTFLPVWPDADEARVERRLARGTGEQAPPLPTDVFAPWAYLVPGALAWGRWCTLRDRALRTAASWLLFLACTVWARPPAALVAAVVHLWRQDLALRGIPEVAIAAHFGWPWWSVLVPSAALGLVVCGTTWWALPAEQRGPVGAGAVLGCAVGGAWMTLGGVG